MQVQVRANAEHAPVPAALQSLVVVGEVQPDEAEAEVGPEHIPELGGVRDAAAMVPDAGREIRLDADPRRPQWHAEAHRTRDRGPGRRGIGAVGPSGADLQVDGERQEAAADPPERRVPTDGSETFSGEIRLRPLYA